MLDTYRYKVDFSEVEHFIEIHEGYSSLCSAVDEEEIKYHDTYMGVRGNNKSEIETRTIHSTHLTFQEKESS